MTPSRLDPATPRLLRHRAQRREYCSAMGIVLVSVRGFAYAGGLKRANPRARRVTPRTLEVRAFVRGQGGPVYCARTATKGMWLGKLLSPRAFRPTLCPARATPGSAAKALWTTPSSTQDLSEFLVRPECAHDSPFLPLFPVGPRISCPDCKNVMSSTTKAGSPIPQDRLGSERYSTRCYRCSTPQ